MAVWKVIPGYDNYEVSDDGRVRRQETKREIRPWSRPPRGYPTVRLGHSGSISIHRLVLEAFVGPCPARHECLHRNDDPTDNRLENLSWGTRSANILDRVRNGTHAMANKTHCKRGHEFTLENTYTRKGTTGRQCRKCIQEARGVIKPYGPRDTDPVGRTAGLQKQ
jgi:hypothetical protein